MSASRFMVLLYGCLVYAAFLPTFLYAIGFVNGFVVPKNVDTVVGEVLPTWQALAINASLLGLFGIQHSIMARHAFKRRWTRIIHPAVERSTFVLLTCAILGLIFWQWRAMPGVVWEVTDPVARGVIQTISGLGWAGVLISTFLIDHFDLFGLSQVVRHFRGLGPQQPKFTAVSLYRHVRHPLYLAFFTAFWFAPTMTVSRLVFAGICTVYVLVAIRLEERGLVEELGVSYRDYQRTVPMIVPRLRPVPATRPGPATPA